MSTIRMTGMVSGLDTESIVSALVSTQVAKKEKVEDKKTLLEWKEEAYESLNTDVNNLYSSISSYRFSSAYNLRTTTVSDTTKATATASSSAVNGTQTLKINQLAKSGYLTGAQLTGSTSSTTLGKLGYEGGDTTITLTVNGTSTDINLTQDSTISDVVSALKNAGVNASYDSTYQRIFVSSKSTGADNDFSITVKSTDGLEALQALGLNTESTDEAIAAYQTMASLAVTEKNDDGTDKVDENGKAVLDEEATAEAIENALYDLKEAYEQIDDLTEKNDTLQSQIDYTDAYDAVYNSKITVNGTTYDSYADLAAADSALAEEYDLLISLVNSDYTKYSFFTKTNGSDDYDAEYQTVYEFKGDGTDYSSVGTQVQKKIYDLAEKFGLVDEDSEDANDLDDDDTFTKFESNLKTIENTIEANKVYLSSDTTVDENGNEVTSAYAQAEAQIDTNNTAIAGYKKTISDNSLIDVGDYTGYTEEKMAELANGLITQITTAYQIYNGIIDLDDYASSGATRIYGQDSEIVLNGATFTSSTNSYTINGLTINCQAVTDEDEEITITTDTDSQGLYDSIKEFLSLYNDLINQLTKLYNADSASDYEPLSDDEKEAMSDSEIEKWESKIKDAILRKDSSINTLMTAMQKAMSSTYTVNGKTYALSSFGIHTLGYLNAASNEYNAYHIDGDSEDSSTGDNTDKLLTAIQNDPETIQSFFTQLATELYDSLFDCMKSTSLSSSFTFYNDKEITNQLSDYEDSISDWEDKIEDLEDRYYNQFSNMETQLSNLQSQSSSLSSLTG